MAKKAGIEPDEASRKPETMADRGSVLAKMVDGEYAYALLPNYPGLFEYPVMTGLDEPMRDRLAVVACLLHEGYCSGACFRFDAPRDEAAGPGDMGSDTDRRGVCCRIGRRVGSGVDVGHVSDEGVAIPCSVVVAGTIPSKAVAASGRVGVAGGIAKKGVVAPRVRYSRLRAEEVVVVPFCCGDCRASRNREAEDRQNECGKDFKTVAATPLL